MCFFDEEGADEQARDCHAGKQKQGVLIAEKMKGAVVMTFNEDSHCNLSASTAQYGSHIV